MNKIIIKDHKACQIIMEDEQAFKVLRATLSYLEPGIEYTAAYQNGWSGRVYLVSKKGMFYYGLLTKVEEFLKNRKIKYDIEDYRIYSTKNIPIDLTQRLIQMNMAPRDYQEKIVNACLNNNIGIVRAATGSGKTLTTALVAAKLNLPTIVHVIGLDLLQQFHDLFSKLFDEPIGFIGNGVCNIERINIASIWTTSSALDLKKKDICEEEEECSEKIDISNKEKIINMLNDTKVHILDECHVCTTNTLKQIYKHIMPEYLFGFSATPFRDDGC